MADVQRLGRVRVPELDRDALTLRKIRERLLGAAARLERGARPLHPAVAHAHAHAVAAALQRLHPGLALEPLELGPRGRAVLPRR